MDNPDRESNGSPRVLVLSTLIAAALALFPWGREALAILHDQGYPCYQCHSLNTSELRPGSNSIRTTQSILATIPPNPSPTAWAGGMPISCDFCHRSGSDVPLAKFTKASKHPVDIIATGDNATNPHEITCNDCHAGTIGAGPDNADLTPRTLLIKGKGEGYGYPNHRNAVAGYAHNLASNPPHLTLPYWSATDNTAFWTGVRQNSQNMICWRCHDGTQQAPFTNVKANANIRAEYTGSGNEKGHAIRTPGGALGVGAALPCYLCHDSHGSLNNALVLDAPPIEGGSPLAVTDFNQASRPFKDLTVCAACHDTGRPATATGTRVLGLDPVDPYDSAATSALHRPAIADNMAASTRNCLTANGGCHANPHNPSASCRICHASGGSGSGPTVAWPSGNASGKATPYGSHLFAARNDNLGTLSDWDAQCNKCHTGHRSAVRVPMPPTGWNDPSGRRTGANMAQALGLDNYAVDNGVGLGGTSTSGTTEADLCWNCHDAQAPAVSEWGFNTKTSPAGFPVVLATDPGKFPTQHDDNTGNSVDLGWIYTDNTYTTKTSNWTAGYLMDEYDPLLKRRIASVHTASFDAAGQSSSVAANIKTSDNAVERVSPALEDKSYIRCSYCHDVHDLNLASSDTAAGKPFLRGSWVTNPYPPELPPRSSYPYPTGAPRNVVTNRDRGGYFIDQNSGWPTENPAMNTVALTAGLCTLCHGTDVDTMKYYTGSSMWGTGMVNGHSNSTLGGTRSNARDIFSAVRGGQGGMGRQMLVGSYVGGGYHEGCYSIYGPYGAPCCMITNDGWYGGLSPVNTGTCAGGDGDYANWYADNAVGGAQGASSMAHKFTCSKCHSPHAAGLPALLTQNCVDTTLGTPTNSTLDFRAVNCHRKTSTSDGWHKLAPGQ